MLSTNAQVTPLALSYLDHTIVFDQDVRWLDVTMHQTQAVKVVHAFQQLLDDMLPRARDNRLLSVLLVRPAAVPWSTLMLAKRGCGSRDCSNPMIKLTSAGEKSITITNVDLLHRTMSE